MADPERPATTATSTSTSAPLTDSKSTTTLTDSEAILTPDEGASTSSPSTAPPQDDEAPAIAAGLGPGGPGPVPGTPTLGGGGTTTPGSSTKMSRNPSFSGSSSNHDDWEASFPPLDRLGVLDILDNFALPQQLEKIQKGLSKSREALKARGGRGLGKARERMVEEWRQRVPSADEQLERYRKRMRQSVEKLGRQWNDTKAVTLREKVAFLCGVMNIFISGYLIGGWPEYMHLWYTAQVLYFLPIRFFSYHSRGYHYFLADLCYFVNFLLILSIWVFPGSKRLFTATYCLAFGNNAVAIIMWRNSLVFHSFDKVTSLFIHIMPCATLHCIVHLIDPALQQARFPAIYTVRHSPPGSPTAYANVVSMLAWSTIPYAVWQLSYYFFITVRRRDKIAAGRPTSFTWLRRSYSKTWIGRVVLGLPAMLQEPAFMMIQYCYAVLTMLPCPVWFYSRWGSAAFLMVVFAWSVHNGATYYIDVFGKRFQKELEAMKAEVAKWQSNPDLMLISPTLGPVRAGAGGGGGGGGAATDTEDESGSVAKPVDFIPLLGAELQATASGVDGGAKDVARERKTGDTDV